MIAFLPTIIIHGAKAIQGGGKVRPNAVRAVPRSWRRRAAVRREQERRRALKAAAAKFRDENEEQTEAARQWYQASARSGLRLFQFEKYAIDTFELPSLLGRWKDGRVNPLVSTFDVVNSLVHAALFRTRSINALEGELKDENFQRILGFTPTPGEKIFTAEPVTATLDTLDLEHAEKSILDVFWKAERNKVFRQGWFGGRRIAAIDGWESHCSYLRHCNTCLTREIEFGQKREDGTRATRTQYYHRYVVAFLVGPSTEVVLGLVPLRTRQQRIEAGEKDAERDEGEETAARRLLDKLHTEYGTFIDMFLLDGLYADGPTFTKIVNDLNYSAIVILKNPAHQPLKYAEGIFAAMDGPTEVVVEDEHGEKIEFWDIDNVTAMPNYDGPVRVIKAVVHKNEPTAQPHEVKSRQQRRREKREQDKSERKALAAQSLSISTSQAPAATNDKPEPQTQSPTSTWSFALIGDKARKLPRKIAHRAIRGRWHIEDTLFHQWVTHWNLGHVYRHTPNALMAILLIWTLVFNLLQIFLYHHLRRLRVPKDHSDTIRDMVEKMKRQMAILTEPVPWFRLLDSS